MPGPYTQEKIENWVGDFCSSDGLRETPAATHEYAAQTLATLLLKACAARDLEPDELEESDIRAGLLDGVARLSLPAAARGGVPELCAAFLTQLEAEGRLGGGRALGVYVRALRGAYEPAAGGKLKPITRPGSRIGRNDPCPCGSGRKYKKCCG